MQKIINTLKSLFTFNKIVVLIAVLCIGYILLSSKSSAVKESEIQTSDSQILIDDHVEGNRNAKVVIVEYFDFECPVCGLFDPVIKEMLSANGQRVAFVKRHLPLDMHANSHLAAKASEAASNQGKFYEMKDLLFANQQSWSNNLRAKDLFINYATSLGLNIPKFVSDMDSESVENRIQRDKNSATRSSVRGTPAFFINGKFVENSAISNLEGWNTEIQKALDNVK